MARMGVFRFVRVVGASSAAACGLAMIVPAVSAAGCGDVEVVVEGIAPVVTGVTPAKGPAIGGTPVVISGHDFAKGATVRFGGALAADVKWVDSATLNVITPHGSGVVAVSVENPSRLVGTLEKAFAFEGAGSGCAVVASTPEIGAEEVPVVGELRVTFSAPVDPASLEGAIKLTRVGGEEVPADVILDSETGADVILKPQQSLRFWGSYAISVDEGVTSLDGAACAPGSIAFATVKPKAMPRALHATLATAVAMTADGHAIVASDAYKGLQTYDVSSPASTSLVSDLVTKFGPRGMVIVGDYGYAAAGVAGVQIFDVSEPTKPALVGHAGTPGFANDVAVIEKDGKTFLVIADATEGIRVEDATDPTLVADLGTIPGWENSKPAVGAVDVEGDTVAAIDGSRLVIASLPDPSAPASATILGAFDIGAALGDVVLSGSRAFVTKQTSGVASYDLTNPAAPVQIDFEADPDGACPDGCLDLSSKLALDGGDLFVVFGRGGAQRFTIDGAGMLTPATHYKGATNARSIAAQGSTVLVGADEGLYVYDRNGDGSPLWSDPAGYGITRTAAVSGDYLYVGDWLRGVQTYSIKDPEAPVFVDRDDTPSVVTDVGAFGTAVGEGVLVVGDGRSGITLFDLADPANPVLGGTAGVADSLGTVLVSGKVAYGCNGNEGILVIDASNPKSPVVLSQADFGMPGDSSPDLAISGNLLYVTRRFGLGVLDVTDPSAPVWKNLVEMPQKARAVGVRVVGTHLLVTSSLSDFEAAVGNNDTRLHVFDVADPAAPALVWTSEDLGGAQFLSVAGDIAFVASSGTHVKIFDVADIERPVLEGVVETPANVSSTVVGKDVVYAVEGAGGVQAIHTGPLPTSMK